MIVLLSYPTVISNETLIINRLLAQHPHLIFHLRKPSWENAAFRELIQSIDVAFHARIVIHQHHELMDSFALKGVHYTEKYRLSGKQDDRIISTSFHQLEEARKNESGYHYFFCSPVFPSISKAGYSTNEVWDISNESNHFKEKAIALGGVDLSRFTEVRQRGFQHIAVLGTIWESNDPEKSLSDIIAHF